MAFNPPPFSSHMDGNQVPTIMGVVGTLGTADTGGTAQTLPFGVDPITGAMFVNMLSGSLTAANPSAGTITQIGTVLGIGGTVTVSGASAGTNIQMVNGTLTLGTVVGKDANAAAQTGNPISIGGTDAGGTVRTVLVNSAGAMSVTGASAGTFVNVVTGTQQTLGTVNVVQNAGTIQGGTINNLATGTINALASGTITGGTLQNLVSGTFNTGTVTVTAGTIGTVANIGALGLGSVLKSTNASTAGSFTAAGTINVTGSQNDSVTWDIGGTWVGTGFFEGQIGTSAFFGINAITPTGVIGTQTIGNGDYLTNVAGLSNARFRLTYSSGTLTYNTQQTPFYAPTSQILNGSLTSLGSVIGIGTLTNVGSFTNGGTIKELTNLVGGTFNAGTVTASLTSSGTLLNLAAGTLGTVTGVGVVSNLTNGSINILTGTTTLVSTVTTVSNLTNGSVNILTGTLQNSGTTTGVGTVTNLGSVTNLGALGLGTAYKGVPAPSSGSFTAAGTINVTGSQLDAAYFDIGGTYVGTGFFEGQVGTSAFFAVNAITPLGVVGTQTTGNGDYLISMAGLDAARFRLTYSSGTLTYNARASNFFAPLVSILGGSVGSVSGIGTLTSLGTVPGIGVVTTVSNITTGSIVQTAGTVTTGTLQNLVTGTINALAAGTITGGTLTNLVSGTINALASGTISTGTVAVTAGTLSPIPTIGQSTFGTIGTTGATIFGTLAGGTSSGAGTEIFVTSVSISIPSTAASQDVSVGFGTNGGTFHAGTGRLVRGNFLAGGGIQKSYDPPINSGTNAQLCYFQAGAGTVNVDVTYFTTASTL